MTSNIIRPKGHFQSAYEHWGDNDNVVGFHRTSWRRAMFDAYGLGAPLNGWEDKAYSYNEDFFSLTAYDANRIAHRTIALWGDPDRFNNGYLFAVYKRGFQIPYQTNALRSALANFKTPTPALRLASCRPRV